MLDVQLFGIKPGPHHVTNLLVHIAASLLLFGFLNWTTKALGRSAFAAALFAVHPVHVESVAWIAERKDVLSALFWMLTICAYVAYVRQPDKIRYSFVLVAYALGLMSKPMLVTLPFVLLLLDVWPLDRRPQIWEKVPLFVFAAASSVVTFLVQREAGTVQDSIPFDARINNVLLSYAAYIGKVIWPAPLAVFYPYSKSVPTETIVVAILILIAVSAVAFAFRRHRYLPVGWLWYLGTLVPVIGFVQVGEQSMADRYTYIPSIGLFIMVSWAAADLFKRYRPAVPTAAASSAILACVVLARTQVGYWKDSLTLWQHTVDVTSDNFIAQHNLAIDLIRAGRIDDAIAHEQEAVRIKPNFVLAQSTLGVELADKGRLYEALPHLREAVRLKSDSFTVRNYLGAALLAQGNLDEAVMYLTEAMRLHPEAPEVQNNLGVALARQNKFAEAIPHFAEAVRLKPSYYEAQKNLEAARQIQAQ
jgi:Flp pilus assembly protein TadD